MSVMVVVVKVRLLSGLQDRACFALAFNSSVPSIFEAVRTSSVISRGVFVATITKNVSGGCLISGCIYYNTLVIIILVTP